MSLPTSHQVLLSTFFRRPPRIVGFNPAVDNLPVVDDNPAVDSPSVVDDNSLQGIGGGFDPRARGIDGFWTLEAICLNFESVEGGRVGKVSLY